MKNLAYLTITAGLMMATAGCEDNEITNSRTVNGTGAVVSQDLDIASFDRIESTGVANFYISWFPISHYHSSLNARLVAGRINTLESASCHSAFVIALHPHFCKFFIIPIHNIFEVFPKPLNKIRSFIGVGFHSLAP